MSADTRCTNLCPTTSKQCKHDAGPHPLQADMRTPGRAGEWKNDIHETESGERWFVVEGLALPLECGAAGKPAKKKGGGR